jgi:periplasmic copper chaperone A
MTKSNNSGLLLKTERSPCSSWMLLMAMTFLLFVGRLEPAVAEEVSVQNPWMRFIIKARPAGGFFTLRNDTNTALTLTGASSPACGMIMLHETKEVNGIAQMLPVKSLSVPAHGTLSFHPGGYHIMCMKPQSTMVVGHEVPVTLKFAGGKIVTASFPVRGPGGR